MKITVAVAGASGYTGGELLRILSRHPKVKLTAVTSRGAAGRPVDTVFPHLRTLVPLTFEALEPDRLTQQADIIMSALPHRASMEPVARWLRAGRKVVDLSADYRLKQAETYAQWYGTPHLHPDLLGEAVYGLPELYRKEIKAARLIGNPGCYPTSILLALAPMLSQRLVDQTAPIIADAKSGLSGAGRTPTLPTHLPEAMESVTPYEVGTHKHLPEIEQECRRLMPPTASGTAPSAPPSVFFAPHLVPMIRGILSTVYVRLAKPIETAELRSLYAKAYTDCPFVRVLPAGSVPSPKHVAGSNFCDLGVVTDPHRRLAVVFSALDNLVKGAAGQAVQNMNLMMGLDETLGLDLPPHFP